MTLIYSNPIYKVGTIFGVEITQLSTPTQVSIFIRQIADRQNEPEVREFIETAKKLKEENPTLSLLDSLIVVAKDLVLEDAFKRQQNYRTEALTPVKNTGIEYPVKMRKPVTSEPMAPKKTGKRVIVNRDDPFS